MAKILVVDDDADFLETTRALLASRGHEVLTASGGDAGYRLARSEQPDLMLLDIMMAYETEGLDTARKIREDPTTRDIPMICLTGLRTEMALPGPLKPDEQWLPVKFILEKPVKPDRILKAVSDALKGRRS